VLMRHKSVRVLMRAALSRFTLKASVRLAGERSEQYVLWAQGEASAWATV
jgi:hypothetical protein